MSALALLYVGFGGAFGAMLRYALGDVLARIGPTSFPYGTLAVNVTGSLAMGMWMALALVLPPGKLKELHWLIAVGALGGFTTFSAFSFDVFLLGERALYVQMALYIVASVALSLLALLLGMWLVRLAAG